MQDIRNIAIIAHVDHGKTTLVDKMLLAGKLFRENEQHDDLYMDNQDLAVSIYPGSRGRTLATRNLEAFREGGQRLRRAR